MSNIEFLNKIANASEICAFIARRGHGVHVALIHLLDLANVTCKRITHFEYQNDQGSIDIFPRDAH
jgi:hypothetical protein